MIVSEILKGTRRALEGHWKGSPRTLQGRSKSTSGLETLGHLNACGTRSLRHLGPQRSYSSYSGNLGTLYTLYTWTKLYRFREIGYSVWKNENFDKLQLCRVENFLQNFTSRFLLSNVYKRMFGIFLFCLDLELLAKTKKNLVSTYSQKPGFLYYFSTQYLNEIKNSRTGFSRHSWSSDVCKISNTSFKP